MKKYIFKLLFLFMIFNTVDLNGQKEIKIAEILVSGDKIEYPESKITDEQIQLIAPRDIGDIFKSITGFGVIKRGGYAMEPVFRSFKMEQLNMMFDGCLKMAPACPNRMDPNTTHVNPGEIEKIEIVKGPYSVRSGQTMGGIINIITKRPHYTEKLEFHGEGVLGYETNGEGKTGRIALGAGNNKIDFFVTGGMKDYGNYKSGWGQEIASSFKNYDYATKLGLNIKSNQRVQLSWRQSFAKDVLHAALPMDTESDESSAFTFDYSAQKISDLIFTINLKAYYNDIDHVMSNTLRPNYNVVHAVTPVFSTSYGGKFEIGLSPTENNFVYIGTDYNYIGKDGSRTRDVYVNACSGMPVPNPPRVFVDKVWQNSNTSIIGFYVENKNKLNEQISLNAGLRFDLSQGEILDPEEDFFNLYGSDLSTETLTDVSGMISLNYVINKQYDLQLAIGRGVRAPKITERYINHFSIGMDAYEYVGDPFLKSEKNNQVDLTLTKAGETFAFQANVFYSYMNDYISAYVDETINKKFLPCNPPANAKRFVNIDKATQYGFELSASYKIMENLSIDGNVYYTHAQNHDFDQPLAEITPLSSTVSVNYKREKFFGVLNARFVAEQNRISEKFNESPSDAFNTLDLKLGYKPWKYLEIDLGVNNIFDANYYEHLSRPYKNMDQASLFFEPGRNFLITIRAKF
ncbi:MAG: TonB-dependent receptor [Bacteroidota bacterium]